MKDFLGFTTPNDRH